MYWGLQKPRWIDIPHPTLSKGGEEFSLLPRTPVLVAFGGMPAPHPIQQNPSNRVAGPLS